MDDLSIDVLVNKENMLSIDYIPKNMYIVDKYKEFRSFVKKRTDKGFRITKDAGVFVAKKATLEGRY